MPRQSEQPMNAQKYYGPIEGDFSKIGCTYVLENDKLTMKTSLYGRQKIKQREVQISEVKNEPEEIEKIKQIAKLQYLEKKGFLKPEQVQRLQKLRGSGQKTMAVVPQKTHKKEMMEVIDQRCLEYPRQEDAENNDPNVFYQNFSSLKNKPHSMKYAPQPQQGYEFQNRYQPEYLQSQQSSYRSPQSYQSSQSYQSQPYHQQHRQYPSQMNFSNQNYY